METRVAAPVLWLYVIAGFVLGQSAKEQCQVYYGGLVFPDGSQPQRSLEHGMHWSKTRSESLKS